MTTPDNKPRSHLPMRNTVPARFIPYDAKDPDMVKTPIEQLRPPEAVPNVLIVLIDVCKWLAGWPEGAIQGRGLFQKNTKMQLTGTTDSTA